MQRSTVFPALAVLVLAFALAAPARAQAVAEPPVSRLVPELVAKAAEIFRGTPGDHSQHFVPGVSALVALESLNRSIALQVAGYPIGPAYGGVSVLDTGEDRVQFGSSYADHGWTRGRGRFSFAVGYQATTFDGMDEVDIRGSDVNVFIEHASLTGDESERDLMQQTISLKLHRKSITFALNYGLSDRLDLAVVVPFVEVAGDARVTARILRTATAGDPAIHAFDPIDLANRTLPSGTQPPREGVAGTGSSTARGFGDVLVGLKFALQRSSSSAIAVRVDARLPSGDSDELIGLGATQVKPSITFSGRGGAVSARARVEYTWSEGTFTSLVGGPGVDLDVPDEIGFAAGLDVGLSSRVALTVDVTGRQLKDVVEFATGDTVFASRGPGPLPSAAFVAANTLLAGEPRSITLLLASAGGRIRLSDSVVANISVLFPFQHIGLRPATSAVFALDYGF